MFRPEVHADRARAAMGTIVLIRPLSTLALTGAALAIAVVLAAYLALAEYSRKAPLQGTLVPASGAIRIVAPRAGLVVDRPVREGERVHAGEVLLRLADARTAGGGRTVGEALVALAARRVAATRRQREEVRVAARREREAQLGRLRGLEAEGLELDAEIAAIARREDLARRSLERLSGLARRGFASVAQRQQKEEELLELSARRHSARRARLALARDVDSLRLSVEQSRAGEQAQLAALDAQLAALGQEEVERGSQADAEVIAPASGTVAALLAEPGQAVAGGGALATLLPAGSPLEAHLYAASAAVGFIRAGQDVRLRFPAFPYQKFGSAHARVLSVSRSAFAPADLGFLPPDGSREPVYRVKVALDAQSVRAYGRDEPLQAGMRVEADVLLDRRRLIEWVFEPLLGLAGKA